MRQSVPLFWGTQLWSFVTAATEDKCSGLCSEALVWDWASVLGWVKSLSLVEIWIDALDTNAGKSRQRRAVCKAGRSLEAPLRAAGPLLDLIQTRPDWLLVWCCLILLLGNDRSACPGSLQLEQLAVWAYQANSFPWPPESHMMLSFWGPYNLPLHKGPW